jgi:DNA-binding Lrp family transcriptional regulator
VTGFLGLVMMDKIDRKILNEIQSRFPLVSRPYEALGKRLGLKEKEVIERTKRLKAEGVIRRIGGNFHSNRLNFTSTLCAAKVPAERIEAFVEAVNRYPGVTHNYLRNNTYNIWFTFIAENMKTINEALQAISKATGVKDILNLPAVKTFKIKVDFEINES